ncbi:oligosaccharide flippase family protein [Raoultella ornithinolytica]|uniref:oligosaccharide flippase family protein n=1 Tax=Raoultella TaxID=160674 RepID=UPI0039B3F57E
MNKKIFSNSLWMMSEKIISIFGLIFVTSFVAKYVGPEIFGNIALAMSIFQLIQLVSQMGTDVLIFKRLSKNSVSGVNLINVTVPVRALVYLFLSAPVLGYQLYHIDESGIYYVVAAFIACFIQSMDVYTIYYDATLNSKVNTFVNVLGLVVSLLVRWIVAFLMLDPRWLCVPIILAPLIPCVIRLTYYLQTTTRRTISVRFRKKYVRYVIGAGSSFVISSLSVAIYTRLSLLTLGFFDGKSAVGVYSIAATLATSWSFILNSIVTSSLPSIFSELRHDIALKKTAKLNLIVMMISFPVIIGVFLLGQWFIDFFYGTLYSESFLPLIILTFSTMFGALGTVSARFIAKYSGYGFLSKKMLLVALVSVIINIIFIYFYGIVGAAFANVLTQFLSLTVFNYTFKRGLVLKMHRSTFSLEVLREIYSLIKRHKLKQ